jgi:hypothetical protein
MSLVIFRLFPIITNFVESRASELNLLITVKDLGVSMPPKSIQARAIMNITLDGIPIQQ